MRILIGYSQYIPIELIRLKQGGGMQRLLPISTGLVIDRRKLLCQRERIMKKYGTGRHRVTDEQNPIIKFLRRTAGTMTMRQMEECGVEGLYPTKLGEESKIIQRTLLPCLVNKIRAYLPTTTPFWNESLSTRSGATRSRIWRRSLSCAI